MKKNLLALLFLAVLAALLVMGSAGADYSFRVPRSETIVEVESDGTMTITVEYEFDNLGQKLDYIDIGLPNDNYTLSSISVWLNGEQNSRIKVTKADYEESGLRHGITLEMGSYAIPSGGSGTVEVIIPGLRKNLYDAETDTENGESGEYVGFQFSPNYFSSKFVKGKTDYSFFIIFPEGVNDGNAYYYTPTRWPGVKIPQSWISEDGHIVYKWQSSDANLSTEYIFGGKFIKSVLTSTANIAAQNGGSSDSGISEWLYMVGGMLICFIPLGIIVSVIVRMIKKSNNGVRRMGTTKYFPPQVKTDGEGIRRGLTAVEAAILLEVDLERVISMILYGLCKKEVIAVKSQEPLEVDIADPLPEGLNDYEVDFIAALREPSETEKRKKMRESMHRLILSVSKKVEGYSLKETKEYYKSICDKAWTQVETAETPELKSQLLGDNFGWAMLQDEPEKKLEETFGSYEVYPPYWWWRVDPGYHRSYSMPSSPSSGSSEESGGGSSKSKSGGGSSSGRTPIPVLPGAMFARSITNSARRLGTSMVGNMGQFRSSVKNRTNPAPVTSGSSYRGSSGGGGSSCACACACASCACACAGGGR